MDSRATQNSKTTYENCGRRRLLGAAESAAKRFAEKLAIGKGRCETRPNVG